MKYLVSIFLIFNVLAQQKFLPHMAIHMNEGCPSNSSCTKVLGGQLKTWKNALNSHAGLIRYVKNFGIPFRTWSTSKESTEHITFDSSCSNHRGETKIYEAIIFAEGPKDLKNKKDIIPNETFLDDGRSFIIPIKSMPAGVKGGKMYFFKETEGRFYNLTVDDKSFSTAKKGLPHKDIIEVKCPQNLIEKFKSQKYPAGLYRSPFCKKIWDFDKNKYITAVFGWSC
jgi:hypothetical protein